jgi:hypothetical protein
MMIFFGSVTVLATFFPMFGNLFSNHWVTLINTACVWSPQAKLIPIVKFFIALALEAMEPLSMIK